MRDVEAIIPNHLLLQKPAMMLPSGDFDDSDLCCRNSRGSLLEKMVAQICTELTRTTEMECPAQEPRA